MSSYRGDVGVRNGQIVEMGKLKGAATRTIDAQGMVVAPGFVDNHCHYDAQVTWDPMCTFSPFHGVTTVLIGNCSLSMAPIRPGKEERASEFLSYVEAIPMDVLRTIHVDWETVPEYMDKLDKHLGINVGTLIGHSALRYYVMGDECQGRAATPDEIQEMQQVVRDAVQAGALGLSITRNKGHYDPQGVHVPGFWAEEDELFALGEVLSELGTGIIQSGGGRAAELENRLMSRLSEATGRQVIYNNLGQTVRDPDAWKKLMAIVDETSAAGIRAYPLCSPNSVTQRFNMSNTQVFRGVPAWHPILLASDEEKLRAYSDPAVRRKLHDEAVEWKMDRPTDTISRQWFDYTWVQETALEKNKGLEGKSLSELAKLQGKGIIDAFLDLVVEENLQTIFLQGENNVDKEAVTKILNYDNAIVGLSDGGAHVQYHGGYGYSTRLLGYWVREQEVMSLEKAVRRLTFDSASVLGIFDRGLLRPGMAADITIFDPDTVNTREEDIVHDFPAGGWRFREMADGVPYTIVNGQVIQEDGNLTGALSGGVLRNSYYHMNAAG
ncbi:N-acyl-D-amino-acid deacylase family protein [Candidatus Entotheonella palauensis]|uniref:N-acyl-D-amino-acid deacylase family protein n=1 Tax=Candidatus Entotheonella palauensis TaxID=93172 RepID=UPI000B7FCBA9|nr:amidohydrolase family protein [Candidatus Entotheonella palauensis]